MTLHQFKELPYLVAFRVLAGRLDREGSRHVTVHILPMAANGPVELEAKRKQKPLEIAKS